MRPLFALFETIGIQTETFYFKDRDGNSALLFNDIPRQRIDGPVTPQDFNITGVPASPWGDLGWQENMANVIQPFAQKLIKDAETGGKDGWKLMTKYDQYSVKAYMAANRSDTGDSLDKQGLLPYPINVVNWCETFATASGTFDKALSESVLENLVA